MNVFFFLSFPLFKRCFKWINFKPRLISISKRLNPFVVYRWSTRLILLFIVWLLPSVMNEFNKPYFVKWLAKVFEQVFFFIYLFIRWNIETKKKKFFFFFHSKLCVHENKIKSKARDEMWTKHRGLKNTVEEKQTIPNPWKFYKKIALCARRIKGKFFFFTLFLVTSLWIFHIQTIYNTRVKLLFNLKKKRERDKQI